MVFSGVAGRAGAELPEPAVHHAARTTPVTREKPYLYLDGGGNYRVFVPVAAHQRVAAPRWANGTTPGTSHPAEPVLRRAARATRAATINQALAQGLQPAVHPGRLPPQPDDQRQPGRHRRPRPRLRDDHPGQRRHRDDGRRRGRREDRRPAVRRRHRPTRRRCCRSARAGAVGRATPPTRPRSRTCSSASAARAPARRPTAWWSTATTRSIDHIWAWRADHGDAASAGPSNTADTGLIVNGDNVTALRPVRRALPEVRGGLERQRRPDHLLPERAALRPAEPGRLDEPAPTGYAAYKVADSVTSHEAWGLGSYCYFNADPAIVADHGFEVPDQRRT